MTRQQALQDLVTLFCGSSPAIQADRISDLSDAAHFELQCFIASNARCQWLTGIGVLDVLDALVDAAIENSEQAFEAAEPSLIPKQPGRDNPALRALVRAHRDGRRGGTP